MSRKTVSEYLRVSWDTVGPIISRVEKELSKNTSPFDNLVNIGIDETYTVKEMCRVLNINESGY